jgi:hypothetical protein
MLNFPALGKVLLKTLYTCSGSVHRRTRFEYYEAGRLIHTVSLDGAGNGLGSSELTYPESKCIWVNRDSRGVITSHGIDNYSGTQLLSTSTFDNEN